jgi:hypothetical protein
MVDMNRIPRITSRAAAFVLCCLVTAACSRGTEPPSATQASESPEACSRCHIAPPPDALPRETWRSVVPDMLTMPVPQGVKPLTPAEAQAALEYYLARAPQVLPPLPKAPADSPIRFRAEHFTPPDPTLQQRRIPAVGNVAFASLAGGNQLDLLISDMRTQTLFVMAPWASPAHRRMNVLAQNVNYPVRANLVDLNASGRSDILVTGIGDMNPGNHANGSVIALMQDEQRRFQPREIIRGLGRPTDARAADFNGNGRLDLIVCAFGWRGPGQLLLLENEGESYKRHVLDSRDGWIHAIPHDINGNGRLDIIAIVAQEHEQVWLFRNQGNMRFEPVLLHQAPHSAWGYTGLELVDLDGDGRLDILLSNGDTLDDNLIKPYHGVSWLRQHGPANDPQFEYSRIADFPGCMAATAADINGNGRMDIVAVAFLPQFGPSTWVEKDLASVIWIEQTEQGWRPHTIERHKCYHPTVTAGDYNGNGKTDIAVGNFTWVREDGSAVFTADYVTLFTQE